MKMTNIKMSFLTSILLISFSSPLSASVNLSVLLTNDDGINSPGLKALSKALRDAGHRLTVVAPADQQSGGGMKVTLGKSLKVEKVVAEDDTWSVDGSPADAVLVGLGTIMKDRKVDLVISGPNFGQNLGTNVFLSGTVGGAMTAVLQGIPAVALSVGINLDESRSQPDRFPSTLATFKPASKFLVSKLEKWFQDPSSQVIPPYSLVNINYPEVGKRSIKGVKWIEAGKLGGFSLDYRSNVSDTVEVLISENETTDPSAKDLGFFNQGYVTLSILSPNWNVLKSLYSF